MAIVDGDKHPLPVGEPGEIVIRGHSVTAGYVNPDDKARAVVDGWLRTGDCGFLDADGYLFLTDRLKDIINRGGEKVSRREVDDVLAEHPAVAQAVTFAVPHPTLGEDVAAAVVLRDTVAATDQELRAFARARLAGFEVPGQGCIVPEIPHGSFHKTRVARWPGSWA